MSIDALVRSTPRVAASNIPCLMSSPVPELPKALHEAGETGIATRRSGVDEHKKCLLSQ